MVERPKFGIRWKVCTYISVDIEAWTKAQKSVKALNQFYATDKGKDVQDTMKEVEDVIKVLFDEKVIRSNDDRHILEKALKEIVHLDARKALEEVRERKKVEASAHLHIIHNYYDYFVKGIADHTIRHGAAMKKYTDSSIRVWQDFGKFLKEYTPKKMKFEDIDKKFKDGFVFYLENKCLMPKSINKQVACFRKLCNYAGEEGVNANGVSYKWAEMAVSDTEKRAEIALSDAEVNALYEMSLTGIREQVRDVFILGLLTAQRVSDYTMFKRDNFKVTKHGTKVITFTQQKTGKGMTVPVIDDRVLNICEKYNYQLPDLNRRDINRYLKEICHELSKSVSSLSDMIATQLTAPEHRKEALYIDMTARISKGEKFNAEQMKRYRAMKLYAEEHQSEGGMLYRRDAGVVMMYRWELVSSHTARRSGITSLYDSGVLDVKDMMSISGHTTLKHFEGYIKRTAEAQADSIADKLAKAREAKTIRLKQEA